MTASSKDVLLPPEVREIIAKGLKYGDVVCLKLDGKPSFVSASDFDIPQVMSAVQHQCQGKPNSMCLQVSVLGYMFTVAEHSKASFGTYPSRHLSFLCFV